VTQDIFGGVAASHTLMYTSCRLDNRRISIQFWTGARDIFGHNIQAGCASNANIMNGEAIFHSPVILHGMILN
jgi:hypothetical protein